MADTPLVGRTALCQRTVIQGEGWGRKQAPQIHLALYIKVKVTESSTGAWRLAGVEEKKKKLYHSSQTFRCGDEPLLILMVRPLGMQIYV